MPLYEYQCDACGHRFEVIQKFSDAPIQSCEKCSGAVRKLLSSPAIQFKGSGWYITDYARAGKSEGGGGGKSDSGAAKGDTKTESKSDAAKSDTKTETKADTKTDSKPAATPSS